MTKQELVNEIAIQTGYDKITILNVVESMMFQTKKALENDESLFLRGFGTFSNRVRAAKMARNIKEGVAVWAPEHKLPYFKACPEFKAQVNK